MRCGPPGVLSVTSSPSRALSSARATGEIQLTSPARWSTSSMPLMVTVRSSPALVGVGDGGAEKHLVAAVVQPRVGHFGDVQALGQKADAPVDLAQALLAVEVVAVLRAVAVLGRPRHHLDDLRPLDVEQRQQLGAQARVAGGREVVLGARGQRRR